MMGMPMGMVGLTGYDPSAMGMQGNTGLFCSGRAVWRMHNVSMCKAFSELMSAECDRNTPPSRN